MSHTRQLVGSWITIDYGFSRVTKTRRRRTFRGCKESKVRTRFLGLEKTDNVQKVRLLTGKSVY